MNGNRGAIQELFSPFSPMYEGFTGTYTAVNVDTTGLKYYVYDPTLVYDENIVVYNKSGDDASGNFFKSNQDSNSEALDNSGAWTQIPIYKNTIDYRRGDLARRRNRDKLIRSTEDDNTGTLFITGQSKWEKISSGSQIHDVDKSRLVNIHSRDLDISGNIKTYGTIYEDISNNYDYGKPDEFPEFAEITRDDVLNQDLQFLMAQQKNTHMIGMIAIATLAVGIFYIARNFRTDTE